jgi:hypothetical protein
MDAENGKPQFEDIDRWLDLALRERANAEPRNGLEERVLGRLASQTKRRRIVWWPVMTAVAVVFVIALTLVVMYPRRQEKIIANRQQRLAALRETPAQTNTVTRNQPTNSTQARSAKMLASTTKHRAVSRPTVRVEPEALPKLATFPAPRPETAEERLLARVAARRGSFDVADVSTDQLLLKDLSVPEFKIHPMEEPPPEDTPQE